jgi:uncharacterized iron-regulated protein
MRTFRTASLLFILVLLAAAVPSSGAQTRKVLRVSDGKVISFDQMMEDLRKVSVVFVGERAESQGHLNSWVGGKLPLEKFMLSYYDNWRMPWPLYRDIFLYAREHQLPMRGLNIPDGISKKIASRGFDALSADDKKHLPPGISCNVDPKYREFIRQAYAEHARHTGKGFENFCEAQMVWDKTMAYHVMGYLRKNPGTSVVVLAGVGHAWRRGISEQMDNGITSRVVLPLIPGQVEQHGSLGEKCEGRPCLFSRLLKHSRRLKPAATSSLTNSFCSW